MPVLPDSHVLLYTDGLVESRHTDIGTKLRTLEVELGAAFADALGLEDAADRVLSALLPEAAGYEDDVTLLLVRFPAPPLTAHAPKSRRAGGGRGGTPIPRQHGAGMGCGGLSETASPRRS